MTVEELPGAGRPPSGDFRRRHPDRVPPPEDSLRPLVALLSLPAAGFPATVYDAMSSELERPPSHRVHPSPRASGPGSRVRCHAEMRVLYLSLLLGRVVTRGRAGAALPDCPDRRKDLNRDTAR